MWTVLVISTFFQVLAMFGIGQNNAIALEAGKADKVYALWPMIAVTSLLVVGVILFICLRKRPFIGLIVAAVAGLVLWQFKNLRMNVVGAYRVVFPFVITSFLLTCAVSALMGTSFGAAATMGAVCMTAAASMGVLLPDLKSAPNVVQ